VNIRHGSRNEPAHGSALRAGRSAQYLGGCENVRDEAIWRNLRHGDQPRARERNPQPRRLGCAMLVDCGCDGVCEDPIASCPKRRAVAPAGPAISSIIPNGLMKRLVNA
jgi:hypothetical protein